MGGFFIFYNNYLGVNILETQVLNNLENIAQSKANRIDTFLSERKSDAIFLSETKEIRTAFDEKTLANIALLENIVENGARRTAIDVENYILNHPNMTLEELQQDPNFKEVAIQRVGKTGYTVLYGPETFVNYLHYDPKEINSNHDDIWNSSAHVQVAKLLRAAEKSEEDVSGFYHLIQRDDEREKFMYIHMLPGRYFDGIKLSIKSTVYIDEFGESIKLASDLDKELEDFQKRKGYLDIILINPDGDIVWTAEQRNDLGTNLKTGPYNDTNLAKVYNIAKNEPEVEISEPGYYKASGMMSIFITKPIFDINPKTQEKILVGIIALQIDNNQIRRLVLNGIKLNNNGEVYIINQNRDHISPLMYEQLTHSDEDFHGISSEQIEKCLIDYNTSNVWNASPIIKFGVYKNYAGINVLGAHQYISQSGWCVLAEMDRNALISNRFNKLSFFEKIIVYVFVLMSIMIVILIILFDKKFQLIGRNGK